MTDAYFVKFRDRATNNPWRIYGGVDVEGEPLTRMSIDHARRVVQSFVDSPQANKMMHWRISPVEEHDLSDPRIEDYQGESEEIHLVRWQGKATDWEHFRFTHNGHRLIVGTRNLGNKGWNIYKTFYDRSPAWHGYASTADLMVEYIEQLHEEFGV